MTKILLPLIKIQMVLISLMLFINLFANHTVIYQAVIAMIFLFVLTILITMETCKHED